MPYTAADVEKLINQIQHVSTTIETIKQDRQSASKHLEEDVSGYTREALIDEVIDSRKRRLDCICKVLEGIEEQKRKLVRILKRETSITTVFSEDNNQPQ